MILFLSPGAAGPSPARSPRCGTKKPGPGGLHPKGRSACGGRRRAANLPREEFGFSRRGNSSTMSRCRPNGLGLRPRITEGNELAMGSSCGPLSARDKGSPKWLARRTATSPQDPDPLPPADPDGPPCFALYSRAYEPRKMSPAGNRLIVDDNDAGCSARKLMLSRGWSSLADKAFPQRQGGRCACAESSLSAPSCWYRGRGGMFLPLVHQGPSPLRRIRPGSPAGRRRRRT